MKMEYVYQTHAHVQLNQQTQQEAHKTGQEQPGDHVQAINVLLHMLIRTLKALMDVKQTYQSYQHVDRLLQMELNQFQQHHVLLQLIQHQLALDPPSHTHVHIYVLQQLTKKEHHVLQTHNLVHT
jgi:hypothetical protein